MTPFSSYTQGLDRRKPPVKKPKNALEPLDGSGFTRPPLPLIPVEQAYPNIPPMVKPPVPDANGGLLPPPPVQTMAKPIGGNNYLPGFVDPVQPEVPMPKPPGPPGATPMPKPPAPSGPNVPSPRPVIDGPYPEVPVPPVAGTPTGTGALGQPLPLGYGLDFARNITPNELVQNQLNALLGNNSAYMQNARQRGAEYAASRGNLNSSIAAGASQRAALEAALPIANADAQAYRDANSQNFESLSQLRQQRSAAFLEDWLSSNTFNREYNGQLAMIPINSAVDMMQYITQRAMEDPAVWTPDVISGWSNFFSGNMFDVLSRFTGNPTTPTGSGGG
jgi:hypothetical protein